MIQALQKKFAKNPEVKRKECERMINRSMRDLERERIQLERTEKKLISDIKRSAKANQMGAVNIMAKDLVRTRRHIQKFYKMGAQMRAVSLRMKTLKSTQAMAESMKGTASAMYKMNKQMNIPEMQRIMMAFERQSEIMDMKEELMGDAIDDAFEEAEDEEEENSIVSSVLEEIGIKLEQSMPAAPVGVAGAAEPVAAEASGDDGDLMARMEALKRG